MDAKWLVYDGKSHLEMDDLGVPQLFNSFEANNMCLVGSPLKHMNLSVRMMKFPTIWKNIMDIPKHQPGAQSCSAIGKPNASCSPRSWTGPKTKWMMFTAHMGGSRGSSSSWGYPQSSSSYRTMGFSLKLTIQR